MSYNITDGMAFSTAYFGAGTGLISMDNVGCFGSPIPLQQSLFDCSYVMAVGDSHAEDVGVRCFDSLSMPYTQVAILAVILNLYSQPNL